MTENRNVRLGPHTTTSAFPLGGAGSGNGAIGASGALRDSELINRPDKSKSLPFTFFAIRPVAEQQEPVHRVFESRLVHRREFDQGYATTRVTGLPRHPMSRMHAEYRIPVPLAYGGACRLEREHSVHLQYSSTTRSS